MDSEWVMCENVQSSDDQIRPSIDINILVVDDDSTTLAIVASMLQIFSYKVETAKNPLDALATLRMQSGVFDLVLTDLHMPYMNGFELQKQVQKEFKLPVIMMSADDDESVMLQSVKSGILFFIPKPVNPEDLKDVWQFALRSKKGKSVVIEEIPPTPTPLLIDLGDDGYDDNQGHQSLSGTGSTSSENASASGAEAAAAAAAWPGALVPMNQPVNKRGNRSPPPEDGKEKGSVSTSSKKACCRPENMLVDAPAGRRRRPRRPKVIWTNSLHNRFLLAINHLTFDKAVPKKILEFMNVPGLTRENVASHLQKYRLFLKKVAENGVAGATRMLADRILLRSSFASGYPIQMMLQTAQQLYPQLPRRPSQPLLLPPPPQAQSQSPPTTTTNNNNNSSIPSSTGPVGVPTLLTNNQPAPANVVQQPVPVANLNGTSTTTATAGNGVAANSNALVNHGGNNGFVGGVNPMQAWQQQNQVRVGPFAGTTYPSNNNVGSPNNYLATNNSAGVDMIRGNMAGNNQLPAGGGVPNGINGIGGARLIGTVNGLGLNGNMMNGVAMGNRGSGANFDYGQVGGAGSFSGGVSGANNPMVAVQAPQVLLNNNYQQQNANAALPPPPPQTQHLQLSCLANLPKGNFNNSNNNAENELADAAENSDPAFGSGGVFLDQDNALPPPNYQVLIEDIHCDISEISFEEEDQNDQLIPTPKTQVQNPDPFAAGPSRVQENAPNTEQSLGLQQLRIEDLIDPFRLMNIENLPQEIDWDALMDAILQDDFAPLNWRE